MSEQQAVTWLGETGEPMTDNDRENFEIHTEAMVRDLDRIESRLESEGQTDRLYGKLLTLNDEMQFYQKRWFFNYDGPTMLTALEKVVTRWNDLTERLDEIPNNYVGVDMRIDFNAKQTKLIKAVIQAKRRDDSAVTPAEVRELFMKQITTEFVRLTNNASSKLHAEFNYSPDVPALNRSCQPLKKLLDAV